MRVRLFFAWLLLSAGILGLLLAAASFFVPGMADPKRTGSLFFAGFFLVAAAYLIGDF